jgi:Condensation domain
MTAIATEPTIVTTTAASVEQRLLWYMEHYRGAGGVLNCPVILGADGALDRAALSRALDALVRRHESLHTSFEDKGRHLKRLIHEAAPVEIADVDLSRTEDPPSALDRAIAAELQAPIDPMVWPTRTTLWKLSDRSHVLCLNMHHLAGDGWSCGIIFNDLRSLYERACERRREEPHLHWQYSDYVRWQQELLERDELAPHRDYWREQLGDARLPALPIRAADRTAPRRPAQESATIRAEVCAALRRIARERRTTLFNVMMSLYYIAIHRLTHDVDLAVTTLFANRLRPELGGTVGAFSNMLILRTQLPPRATFADVLLETHATVLGAFLHQAVPFQALPGVAVRGDSYRADDIVFHMTADRFADGRMGDLEVRVLPTAGMGNRFTFEVVVLPAGDELTIAASYNQARIDRAWVARFLREYVTFACAVADSPDARVNTPLGAAIK